MTGLKNAKAIKERYDGAFRESDAQHFESASKNATIKEIPQRIRDNFAKVRNLRRVLNHSIEYEAKKQRRQRVELAKHLRLEQMQGQGEVLRQHFLLRGR